MVGCDVMVYVLNGAYQVPWESPLRLSSSTFTAIHIPVLYKARRVRLRARILGASASMRRRMQFKLDRLSVFPDRKS